MADIGDYLVINAMNENNNTRLRAKSLEDNYGVKVEDVSQYRNRNGGFGIMKAIGWAATAIIAGAVIAATVTGAAMAAPIGLIVGGFAAGISMLVQHEKVMAGYSGYLDEVSAQAREGKAKSPARETQVSPQEAAELKARLATLEAKSHVQQLTTPQMAAQQR